MGCACRDVARWEWKAPAFHKYVSSTQIRRMGDEIICPAIVETHGSASHRHKTHNAANICRGDVACYVSTCDAQSQPFATWRRSTLRLYRRCTIPASNPENLVKIMVQIVSIFLKNPSNPSCFYPPAKPFSHNLKKKMHS